MCVCVCTETIFGISISAIKCRRWRSVQLGGGVYTHTYLYIYMYSYSGGGTKVRRAIARLLERVVGGGGDALFTARAPDDKSQRLR